MAEGVDQDMVGAVGRVTVPIDPEHPGEVLLPVRGGTEAFAAMSDEVVAKHAKVVVIECSSARSVVVTPCS